MSRVLVIAEAGNNHEGSLDTAFDLIDAAKAAGADLVKFQAGNAAGFARRPEDIPRYRKYELGVSGYNALLKRGLTAGIPVFFSVWSDEFGGYWGLPWKKIASRQCNPEMIKKYDGERTFVSIPHTMKLTAVKKLGIRHSVPLHCVTEYPADKALLGRLGELHRHFPRVGYSDHTIGIAACIGAVELGASVIEKHFTLAHDFGPLRDHALSATPKEMHSLVKAVNG